MHHIGSVPNGGAGGSGLCQDKGQRSAEYSVGVLYYSITVNVSIWYVCTTPNDELARLHGTTTAVARSREDHVRPRMHANHGQKGQCAEHIYTYIYIVQYILWYANSESQVVWGHWARPDMKAVFSPSIFHG